MKLAIHVTQVHLVFIETMVRRRCQFTEMTQLRALLVINLMRNTSREVLSLLRHDRLATHLLFQTESTWIRILYICHLIYAADLREVSRCDPTHHVLVKL